MAAADTAVTPPEPESATDAAEPASVIGIEQRLQQRVRDIVTHIQTAKTKIAAVRPQEISSHDIRAVAGQLDAVGREAEHAATAFLNAAERLDTLAGQLPDKASNTVQEIATQIFEASTFHDLTGQRITQAMRMLHEVENKLSALSDVLHNAAFATPEEQAPADADVKSSTGDAPLAGPDPDPDANRQDDIDAILSRFD